MSLNLMAAAKRQASVWVVLTASLLAAFAGPLAHAATEDVYTVRNVPVDATANEAAEARVIAIRQGRARALRMLFQRLTLEADWPMLPVLRTSEVTALGSGFEIANERNSPTRYLATITYRFKPADVRAILQQNGIPFSEVQARKMVVLPVLIQDGEARIFQDDMNWSFAWSDLDYAHELVPLVTPLGDLGDVIAAPAEAALDGDFAALSGFAERYNVQDILIAKMQIDDFKSDVVFDFVRLSPTEKETWTLVAPPVDTIAPATDAGMDGAGSDLEPLVPFSEAGQAAETTDRVPVDGLKADEAGLDDTADQKSEAEARAERLTQLMHSVIGRGVGRLQEDWKARTIIRFDSQETLIVSARFEDISQWLIIKRAVQATPNISENRLVALSTAGAHMEWDILGTPTQLALALSQHNVAIEPGTAEDIAETEEISEGAFISRSHDQAMGGSDGIRGGTQGGMSGQGNHKSDPTNDPSAPWNPDEAAPPFGGTATVDQVTEETLDGEQGISFGDMMEEERDAYTPIDERNLPPVGVEAGRFFTLEETDGTIELQYGRPEFWIVRYAPKVDPQVWPTDEGAPVDGNADGGEDADTEAEEPEQVDPFDRPF